MFDPSHAGGVHMQGITKFMLFNRTLTGIDIELVINDVKLEQVNTFNFLGLTINNTLDWSSHLSNIN